VKVTVTNAQNRVIVNDDTNVVTVEDAGTTVTVSETGPQGPAGPGGADGHYGQFYDTTDQVAASTTQEYPVEFNSVDSADGISVENDALGNPTRITFGYQGTYNVQFSLQFVNTASQDAHINVWFRLDGTDIPDSNSQYTVPQKHGSDNGAIIAALNFLVDVTANQYVEIVWQTENTAISLQTLPAGTTPTTPATPSAIVTATQVMYTEVGPAGPGVATGGSAGTVLVKNSATNYDTAWSTYKPGMYFIKEVAIGTAVASVQVTSAFNATFDNYFVTISGTTGSRTDYPSFQLRFGATTAAYYSVAQYVNVITGGNGFDRFNNTSGGTIGYVVSTDTTSTSFTIHSPYLARRTQYTGQWAINDNMGWIGGTLNNTTSYTAFTILPVLGSITGGTIRVYGYNQ